MSVVVWPQRQFLIFFGDGPESPKNIEKDLIDAGFSNAAIEALMNFDEKQNATDVEIQKSVPSPCIANNSPREKFEQFKADSNYLNSFVFAIIINILCFFLLGFR